MAKAKVRAVTPEIPPQGGALDGLRAALQASQDAAGQMAREFAGLEERLAERERALEAREARLQKNEGRNWLMPATQQCINRLRAVDASGAEAAEILEEAVVHFQERRYRVAILDCARTVESLLVIILRGRGETPPPGGGDCLRRLEDMGLIAGQVSQSIHKSVFAFRNEAAHAGQYKPDANTTRLVFGSTCAALHYLFTLVE